MEKILSAIKAIKGFFDLPTYVVVVICITSALLKWVIPIEESGAIVRTVATVIFVLTFVYIIVLLAFYGCGRYSRKKQQLDCLRNLTPKERAFLTYYIERNEAIQMGRGSIPLLLEQKGIIKAISMILSSKQTAYALNDWARQLLTKNPSLLTNDKS